MNPTKGIIFISNVTKALEHEWFVDAVDRKELDLEFVLFNSKNSELYNFIKAHGFKCSNYRLPSKYYVPFYILYFTTKLIFKRFDFVHCHLFEASLIGIISSKIAGVKKRIHTRHHADFHHVYFPGAVKYDLLINALSTHIVAISSNIKNILVQKENVPMSKIILIPHGIPSELMNKTASESEIEFIRTKYDLLNNAPVIGVISRFIEWKGVQYIVPAFKKILNDYPGAKLVLANAVGNYEYKIKSLLTGIPDSSFLLIPFEPRIDLLYKTFDVFVHAPIDSSSEAFGQVYVEALAYEIPMVCTLSGIAPDLITDGVNAVVTEHKNSEAIYHALNKIIGDPDLRKRLTGQGKADVAEFTFEKKYAKLKTLYLN